MGNNMTPSGNSSFPSMGEFEIGTFVAPTQSTGNSGDAGSSIFKASTFNAEGNGSQYGGGGRNVFGQSQSGRPIAGPGIRETGIIEKLLVRNIDTPISRNFYRLLIGADKMYCLFLYLLSIFPLYSIHMDLFNAAIAKLVYSSTFRNLMEQLSI